MSLTKYELKKMLKTPVTLIAIAAVFLLNIYMLLLGSQDGDYCYKAQLSPFQTDIVRLQENGAYFAGEINDAWFEKFYAEAEAMRNDPANQVSDAEKELILQELRLHLTEEAITERGVSIFFKEEFTFSNEYDKYEDMEFSAQYFERAQQTKNALAEQFRERFPGKKGEVLAAKTEQLYGDLTHNYTARYNYDWGYHKLRNMHTTYPYTIGLLILIALSPLFAAEYAAKTDALLLTSKHGKRRLITAKIKAGLLFTVLSWAAIQLSNIALVFGIYGTTGAEAYWQDWMRFWAPFQFNQLQFTLVTIATSLLGALFLAGIVMAISAFSKNQFISLLAGGVVVMLPIFSFAFTSSKLFQTIFNFLPTRVLMAVVQWQGIDFAYLFGKAVPMQVIIFTTAAMIMIACMFVSFFRFKRHQVEN